MTRVLLIEDDDCLRDLMRIALRFEGYTVESAAHGGEAIEKIRQQPPDAIITDLQMPVIDGLQFTRWLRREAQLPTPLLLLTALGNRRVEEDVREEGVDAVLYKPVMVDVIVDALRKLLNR